jgi:hypothetical protein
LLPGEGVNNYFGERKKDSSPSSSFAVKEGGKQQVRSSFMKVRLSQDNLPILLTPLLLLFKK